MFYVRHPKIGGLPTSNPPPNVKDGQYDQTEKGSYSSNLVALEEEHDDRRRSSYPDHLVGDSPRYGGTTRSDVVVTPIMVRGDDRTIGTIVCDIGMMGGAKYTVLDECNKIKLL